LVCGIKWDCDAELWKKVGKSTIACGKTMFIGEYTYKIDEKKRVAVPPKFRDDLKKKAVVTRGLDNCLFLYSMEEWQKIAEKISQLPFGQEDGRGFSRIMLSGAMEVEFDSSGRILVPDYLKDYALLKKDVVVAGLYNRIEIWDKSTWEKYKSSTEKELGNIAERLKEFGL
jgi:MraZ protein